MLKGPFINSIILKYLKIFILYPQTEISPYISLKIIIYSKKNQKQIINANIKIKIQKNIPNINIYFLFILNNNKLMKI